MAILTQGDADDVVSDINVTPLVDVMLVLLVVFIVTAPLLSNAVKVHLPQTAVTSPLEPKKAVTVSVDARGEIYIDRRPVALRDLEGELRQIRSADADVVVHLSADESSNYGLVAKVMAAADRAGIAKISVITVNE